MEAYYICFSMETINKNIFYMGIASGQYPEKGGDMKKLGLPVRKIGREYPYLLGKERARAGRLQIYYVLLPEYCGRTFFTGKPKRWKAETAQRLLEEAEERAIIGFDCQEQVMAAQLTKNLLQIPPELLAVCLYQYRPFDKLCISLPKESRDRELEEMLELITPYLPRMKQVTFAGEEGESAGLLEDYLYEEFGIVMTRAGKVPDDRPWLDLQEGGPQEADQTVFSKKLKHISRRETLKFLDTTVKSGYNTKVD
ncbi:MAG: hypothetical protein K2G19_10540 [Lachnospiraceae bacterium]|nr:hypothetical protein [Lachnospiraceae bacterium]